jgi:hypothetical protein
MCNEDAEGREFDISFKFNGLAKIGKAARSLN